MRACLCTRGQISHERNHWKTVMSENQLKMSENKIRLKIYYSMTENNKFMTENTLNNDWK